MIVGNGMIAKAFLKYPMDVNTIIFASGVSNSQEDRHNEFDREFNLLKQHVKEGNHLVYFSTTSIYDLSLKETYYVKHKNQMEDYIKSNSKSYNIFRLPIVVGDTANPSTLIKFLYNKISNGETINVFSKACRSILDVEDLAFIVNEIIKLNMFKNEAINIYLSPNTHILEIISVLEKSMGIEANKNIIDKGNCYEIDNTKLETFLSQINYQIEENYIFKTINKYYK